VGRVRAMALAAYAHQDLPFEQLVDALVTDRDRSRTPLFQAFFNYFAADVLDQGRRARLRHNASPGVGAGEDADRPTPDVQPAELAKFDLRLILTDAGGGLTGMIQYSTALFEAATIGRMASHLITLLEAAAVSPGRALAGLQMMGRDERELITATWNATAAPVPGDAVHEMIAAQAAARPDAVAVASGAARLTYGNLMARAGRLAQYLRSVGVGTEMVVGLCLPGSVDMVMALLAVWQAGGAYLPLDPGYPAERLGYMLADSRAAVLIGTEAAIEDLPAGRLRTIALDDPLTQAALKSQVPPATRAPAVVLPGQLAYVSYTSGSTGMPKGVQVTHDGLMNYVATVPDRTGLGQPGAQYGLLQPPVTDFGNTTIFVSLVTGGVLHILDPDVVTDPVAVAEYLAAHAIDYLKMVPSHLAALVDGAVTPQLLPARTLVLGGETAPRWLVDELRAVAGHRNVVNHYGPTETTIGVATFRLTRDHPAGSTIPIGSPIANTRLYVLDQHLNPAPVGVAGELFIGGTGVARGYGHRPGLTAQRFVADPYRADGSRLYRSGDRVRWMPGGHLEFLGRTDDQVKVRGFRVEPGEVEAVLASHSHIASAVVAVSGKGATRRLVAYLVPADHSRGVPAASELRAFARERLPEFMIPSVFTELSSLPLTPSGKLDRAALPTPDDARPDLASAFVAPTTPAEEVLATIWAQLLGLDRVGTADSFFDLGGNSLLVVQVVTLVRASGYDISVGDLFDHPTIAAVAPLLRARTEDSPLAREPRIRSAVSIRSGTAVPAIFCVHSSYGTVAEYAELARHLGEGQQFYGLQSRAVAGEDPPPESIMQMASAYLSEVRGLQQEGPYLFAGWSMGGYIAIEMARRVTAMGKSVGCVFLIGPPLQPLRKPSRRPFSRAQRELLRQLDATIDAEPGQRLLPGFEERFLEAWHPAEEARAAVRAGDKQQLRTGRIAVANSWAGTHYRSLMQYRLKPYDGRVVLFVPAAETADSRRMTLEQWRTVLRQEPEIVDVPGEHDTLIYGNGAEEIGARLNAEISSWQRSGGAAK
jgi:amino acid adenylation domain-containing protein